MRTIPLEQLWRSDRLLDKFKFAFFNPRNFLPWVKSISWGKKKTDLNLTQGLMMYFPQEGCSLLIK